VKEPTDSDFLLKQSSSYSLKEFTFLRPPLPPVTVLLPEQLAASYGLYVWPAAPVLAWYLALHDFPRGLRVLELGAGTALPGLLLAKLGHSVTLSDNINSPNCLKNCREAVLANHLEGSVSVLPLSWGLVTSDLLKLRGSLDLVIGSDLFFDPSVFSPLLETVSWLLTHNPGAQFITSVQERSADWSIELLLRSHGLSCSYSYPHQFLRGAPVAEKDLVGNHNIFILKISKTA